MRNLKIYVIADKVSETILSVFSANSDEMALRQFNQALEVNKDKIYDKDSIILFVPYPNESNFLFNYMVPETYDEVLSGFVSYNEYIGDCGQPISKTKEV